MPFVVPEINVFARNGPLLEVESNSDPDAEQLSDYIVWLEQELATARAAYVEQAGEAREKPEATPEESQ
jgi:hypothetical protein